MHRIRINLPATLTNVSLRTVFDQSQQLQPDQSPGESAGSVERAAIDLNSEVASLCRSIQESIQELEQRRQNALIELQQVAVELAIEVAASVAGAAIEADRHDIEGLVDEALAQLGMTGPVTLRLNPADLVRLRESESASFAASGNVHLVGDASLAKGSVIAESSEGMILSTLTLRLETIRRALLGGLEGAQTERRTNEANNSQLRRFPERREIG